MPHDAYELGRFAGRKVRDALKGVNTVPAKARELINKNKRKALALALIFAPVAVDTSGILRQEVSIEALYEARVAEARREYERRRSETGLNISFAEFLVSQGVPSPDKVEALMRQLEQYEAPVYVESGYSLALMLINLQADFDGGGFVHSRNRNGAREHVIFHSGEIEFNNDFVAFMVSEQGHIWQDEKGELHPLEYLRDWIRYFGQRERMYATPDNPEGRAHQIYEPEVERRLTMLRDDYKVWAQDAARNYARGIGVREYNERLLYSATNMRVAPFSEEDMSYQGFERMLRKLERDVNTHSADTYTLNSALFMMRLIENLPSYRAEQIALPDNSQTVRIIPTQELYREFIAYLNPYEPTSVPPYAQPWSSDYERQTLAGYERFRADYNDFYWRAISMYRYYVSTRFSEEDMRNAMSAGHPDIYTAYLYRYSGQLEEEMRRNRQRGQPDFSFEMYQRLAEHLKKYVEDTPQLDPNDSSANGNLLHIFNNACRFAPDCPPDSGIIQNPETGAIEMHISQEGGTQRHYEVIRDLFMQSRAMNEY